MKRKYWVAVIGVSTLALLALPRVVGAQISSPAPERPKIDENGVDIQAGYIHINEPGVRVGGDAVGALHYERTYDNAWRSNFSNFLDFREEVESSYSSKSMSYGNVSRNEVNTAQGMMTIPMNDGHDWGALRDGTVLDFFKVFVALTGAQQQYINFLSSVTHPNGVVYTFHYKDSTVGGVFKTRVQSITSNAGYQLKFKYITDVRSAQSPLSPDWEQISSVTAINNAVEYCDPIADSCQLSRNWPTVLYSAPQTLNGVTSSTTTAPGYGAIRYESAPDSYRIFNPDGTVYKSYTRAAITTVCIAYNCPGGELGNRVTLATMGQTVTSYAYQNAGDSLTVTVSRGAETRKYISSRNAAGLSFIDENGRSVRFDEFAGNIVKIINPEGDYFTYSRDARGNVLQEIHYGKSGGQLNSVTRSFPAVCNWQNQRYCNSPESITDAAGKTTSYTYAAAHGGVLTELGPLVNGAASLKRYGYVQRYARWLNATGAVVQAASPIWLLSEERLCRTGATTTSGCSGGSADEVVTTYDYGPDVVGQVNNLMLRGKVVTADGVSQRTCYVYDAVGNRIAETAPAAGLASCA
ncbi:hypothetical protein [Brevundimonas sp. SL130]|uniref:hypothetical protein n=1 Tax=Brevundimonas sp. SL130 TaxID=2995143 RepID=UPI00226D1D52|nr:hypothetical protein [Brevundimonas sp. SL130]WAC59772.1 hypothetical protein OU998_16440 [Brevundimonas sp. SL130]